MLAGFFTGESAISLAGVLNEIKTLIPVILPTVVGFMAFRKGWSFLRGAVKGA